MVSISTDDFEIVRHACDIVKNELETLHRANGQSWRNIAQMTKYQGIPAGTLCSISKGKLVPNKHRHQLGVPYTLPVPACSACGQAHAIDRACEKRVIVRDKPKPRKQRDRYPRYYSWLFEEMTRAEDWR